ncbi:unnamed protein product [Knipowitschia caucasica]|uniref:Transmembrane protein 51 n=1 Tax=Knipowitschia caucasica TaxID=637954 RepID=A0AAV2LXK4_KNICA
MRSSGDVPTSQNGRRAAATATVANNNNTGNSGSQYALCALGVGLVALGVVMIVWSVVPTDPAHNHSVSTDPDPGGKKSKASSVAFVLVGSGVAVLLLSLCLGMRNKQREQQFLQRQQQQQRAQGQAVAGQTDAEAAEEQARRYAVPTYEEAVGSGLYPVPQSGPRLSESQLPSYEDLVTTDSLQYEHEGPTTNTPPPSAATLNLPPPPSTRKQGRNKLLPINIRRIKSEKLHMKDVSQPPSQMSIEPLTPPPQYEDKAPPLN